MLRDSTSVHATDATTEAVMAAPMNQRGCDIRSATRVGVGLLARDRRVNASCAAGSNSLVQRP